MDSGEKFIVPTAKEGDPFIFVSYSRKDMKQVQQVLYVLKKNHYSFWYDLGLKCGVEWAEELEKRIIQCEQFLVLMSPNSVASKFVRKEIEVAIDEKPEGSICVLYLKETTLQHGLKLLLGNIHAYFLNKGQSEEDFSKTICELASNKTQRWSACRNISGGIARTELERNFELKEEIGRGGVSSVYFGIHRRTAVPVAVKCGKYTDINPYYDEKRILGYVFQNTQPYVPALLDWYADEDNVFLVESFISGKTLDIIAREYSDAGQRFNESDVVKIAIKVLRILACVHCCGVIHGDVKPQNIIIDEEGEIFLIDFNTSICDAEGILPKGITHGYSPPEQYDSKCGFYSDIYSLGRTIIWLLCGDVLREKGMTNNPSIRYYRKDISPELEDIICKMTAIEPDLRYQTADAVIGALEIYKKMNPLYKVVAYINSFRRKKTFFRANAEHQLKRKRNMEEIVQISMNEVSEITTLTEDLEATDDNDRATLEDSRAALE